MSNEEKFGGYYASQKTELSPELIESAAHDIWVVCRSHGRTLSSYLVTGKVVEIINSLIAETEKDVTTRTSEIEFLRKELRRLKLVIDRMSSEIHVRDEMLKTLIRKLRDCNEN